MGAKPVREMKALRTWQELYRKSMWVAAEKNLWRKAGRSLLWALLLTASVATSAWAKVAPYRESANVVPFLPRSASVLNGRNRMS